MTAEVTYNGELRASALHKHSGSIIETDAPIDNQGKGADFSPTDLVATALASCILTTIGIAAPVHNLNIEGAIGEVTKVMKADPRRIGEIVITFRFPNSEPFTDKQKKIIQHIANTCPVHASLHPDCIKSINYIWP